MSSEMIFIELHDSLGWYVIIGSIADLVHFNKITTMESVGEGWDFKLSKPLFVGKETLPGGEFIYPPLKIFESIYVLVVVWSCRTMSILKNRADKGLIERSKYFVVLAREVSSDHTSNFGSLLDDSFIVATEVQFRILY